MSALAQTSGGFERIPPQNLEAEMALIGSILVDREMMSSVLEIVKPADFYAHTHETIFGALFELYERGEPLDKVTVGEDLRRRNLLEKTGGMAYLTSLMDMVPTAASAIYYAKIVAEKSSLRGLIHAGSQIAQIGFEGEENVEDAIDRSEQIVYEVGRRSRTGDFAPIDRLLKGAFEHIDRLYQSHGDRTGVTSGFKDIDDYTAGFQPGNFIILAARPAMGKTSLALSMAAAASREEQKPIAIFSLEMTNEELVMRLLCGESRINSQNLRKGNVKDAEWERIAEGMNELAKWPVYLDDSGSLTVTEVRSRCRRLQASEGLSCVFIDYLQLLRPSTSSKNQNRNDELSEICRTLKATAKDLQVPIIALAQLNRGVESRNDKRPMLADLRDCLAGDALVTDARTGERISMRDIVAKDLRFDVWAVDEAMQMVPKPITAAWQVGPREMRRVQTRSGRVIHSTTGHRYLTIDGWRTLAEIAIGTPIAVPRRYEPPTSTSMSQDEALLLGWLIGDGHLGGTPTITCATAAEARIVVDLARAAFDLRPIVKREHARTEALRVVLTTGRLCGAGKNRLTGWLRRIGIWGTTGARKHVPREAFLQDRTTTAALLRGLFHADGSFSRTAGGTRATVRLSTISERLAREVQHLLLRFEIDSIVASDERNIGGFRTTTKSIWTVRIQSRESVVRYLSEIGFVGDKHAKAMSLLVSEKRNDAGQFDRLPIEANALVTHERGLRGWSHAKLGWRDQGKRMSRATCETVGARLENDRLVALGRSDLLWDEIVACEPAGVEVAYDLTVDGLHNFCVDDVVTHNSGAIEQEADLVAFIYRDAYYNPETAVEADVTEFIIAKQRNGPVGTVKLRFLKEHTLFVPYGDASHYSAP